MSLTSLINKHKKLIGNNFVVIGAKTSPTAIGYYDKKSGTLSLDKNIILMDNHSFTSDVKSLIPKKDNLNIVISTHKSHTINYKIGSAEKPWGTVTFY